LQLRNKIFNFPFGFALLSLLAFLISGAAYAQRASLGSAPDPFQMSIGNGEPTASINSNGGYTNTNGRTVRSSVLPNLSTTLVMVYIGQSLAATSSTGAAIVPTNDSHVFNFNIYDSGLYPCRNPVLGAAQAVFSTLPVNSPGCSIGDTLVTNAVFTDVVVVPIAIGGTTVADWSSGGAINNRIAVTVGQLAKKGLTTASGFTGTFYIMLHIGETDGVNGTSRANMATGVRNMAAAFVSAGTGTSRFFVATESMTGGITVANIQNGQADAVASGCSTCRAGANWDTSIPNSGGNRQSDGTHLAGPAAGLALAVSTDVTIITNCKNTAC
jgi:hypothetical protein